MTNEETKKNKIKNRIKELKCKFGGFKNIALTREAYNHCNPDNPDEWACDAVQIEKNVLWWGKVLWTHADEREDASDYDFTFCQNNFEVESEFDLNDNDELDEALEHLR